MNNNIDLNKSEIIDLIIAFNNDPITRKLESFYGAKSILEIIGSSRKELVHSNFIAWVLDPSNDHNFGHQGVRNLLELLSARGFVVKDESSDEIVIGNYDLEKLKVTTEFHITSVGRVDVLVEGDIVINDSSRKFRIILENKVGTKEHSDQTQKYYDYFQAESEEEDLNLYVYLTPISTIELDELEEPQSICKEYIHINYQLLVDYILIPLLERTASERVKNILKEYLMSLSQPSFDDDINTNQGLIMALGVEERELLSKFWEKNKKLIGASFYAISSDPDQQTEARDKANEMLDFLSKTTRDTSKYSVLYDGEVEFETVSKSDIGLVVVKVLDKYNLIDDDMLQFLREDKTCSFQLIKTLEEITDNEKKYRKYRWTKEPELIHNETGYFVARNWGYDKPNQLLEKVKQKVPKLSYKHHV